MTNIEEELAENLTIRPEDYSLYIRALWKSHQNLDKKFDEIVVCLKDANQKNVSANKSLDQLSRDVSLIKNIFLLPSHLGKIIKYTAYVLGPIVIATASLYSIFHKGSGH